MNYHEVGTAHRTQVQRDPIMHILIGDGSGPEGYSMWCSSSPGRPDSAANTSRGRFCSTCKQLYRDAVAEGMMDPSEVSEFAQFLAASDVPQ